ncbi:MAG TPA: hypothetical protein ENJ46_04655, partial [Hellea balneolensis]|nr:hypothetical protein [Hellea balneolensis]
MLGAHITKSAASGRRMVAVFLRFLLGFLSVAMVSVTGHTAEPTAVRTAPKTGVAGSSTDAPLKIEKILIAELEPDYMVVLEGKTVNSEVSRDKNNGLYVRAEPIFKALNDEFEYDAETGALTVKRSQDGVVMELHKETGIVKANGKPLGRLKQFGQIEVGKINLTPNAIAVLSGAIGKLDKNKKQINFELDPRLKVLSGFDIFVDGVSLGNLQPGPKAIGSVMLIPLRP